MKTTKSKQPTPASQKKPSTDSQLTFLDHVYELRRRIFWVIATLLVASAAGFQFKDTLVSFVMMPLDGQKLVYLTPGGGFSFIFTLCLYFGAFLTIPIIVYHLYKFLQPVMKRTSRRLLGGLLAASSSLAVIGATFGYVVAIPAAIHFLTGFAGEAVTATLTAESYLSFVMAYMFGLAALFQLPLLVFMFDHIHRFPPGTLMSMQRFVVVGAVIAAAIITPTPDVVNQMIIAGPIVIVYQLGVVAVWLRRRNVSTLERTAEPTPPVESVACSPVPIVATPAPVDIQPQPRQPVVSVAKRRSIDGFVRSAVPPAVPPAKPISNLMQPRRAPRSLDGFSIV